MNNALVDVIEPIQNLVHSRFSTFHFLVNSNFGIDQNEILRCLPLRDSNAKRPSG